MISQQFEDRWQLPNCVGAGDGKHIRIKGPRNSSSRYFNYKGYFSIVLMAFVGPRYEFLFVDAGCQGSGSDEGVFRSTKLWKALKENSVYLPPAKPLLSRDQFYEDDEDLNIEHYFVCDIEVTSWLVSADDFSSRVARGANERVSAANE